MQSQINKTQILAKLKKCHKNIQKLNDKLDVLQTIIKKQNFSIDKNSEAIKPKEVENPVVIIDNEASVEVIINAEDPQQEQAEGLKQTARKLISRFYYHVKQKMKQSFINQIEALKQFCQKENKNNLYQKLHQGLQTLYFDKDQKCKQCHQIIKEESTYLNHIRNEHLNDLEIYICIKCKLTFSQEPQLEKHIQQEHTQFQNHLLNSRETKSNLQPSKTMLQINGDFIQHRFNQKLDLDKIVQNIQPQPIIKKVLEPQQINNNNLSSSSDEAKQSTPLFNQNYIPIESKEGNQEQDQQEKQDICSKITKKPSKFKINFISKQKNDKTLNN